MIKFLYIFYMMALFSCEGKKTDPDAEKNGDSPIVIKEKAEPRDASIKLLPVQMLGENGRYIDINEKSFINNSLTFDLSARPLDKEFDVDTEEDKAKGASIFMASTGLLFKLDPAYPVTVTLSTRDISHVAKYAPQEDGLLAISFARFAKVYPPSFREKYELKIESLSTVAKPFSYVYSFSSKRANATVINAKVVGGDGVHGFKLGDNNPTYSLGSIVPSDECESCAIEVLSSKINMVVKTFTELPVIPSPSFLKVSIPRRYAGLIVKYENKELKPTVKGNSSAKVDILVGVSSLDSSVKPWCKAGGDCKVPYNGVMTPTYYKFVNVVPKDDSSQTFGSTQGIASISIYGTVDVSVKRSGVEVSKGTLSLDSGVISPLNALNLPSFVLDDLKEALLSGAFEFQQ